LVKERVGLERYIILNIILLAMQIIAHRGASGTEPENTLRSFSRSLTMNIDAIELDVHLTKDKKLVVIHDNSVKRTTNGKGYVKNLMFKQLRELNAGLDEKIPLLEEVFDLVNKKVMIHIELKGTGTARPVAKLIEEYVKKGWWYNHFIISSFKFKELEDFYKINKKVRLAVLFERNPNKYLKKTSLINAYSINFPMRLTSKKYVEKAHKENLKLLVWTVNTKRGINRMRKLKVDGIFTNFPEKTKE
jgi:glycerophosphoryl diester phosphodiesterase